MIEVYTILFIFPKTYLKTQKSERFDAEGLEDDTHVEPSISNHTFG